MGFARIEGIDAELAQRLRGQRALMRAEHIRATAGDDRQRGLLVDRLRRVAPRQVERAAVHDVGEQTRLAENARLNRLEQITVAGGRSTATSLKMSRV